MPCKKSGSQANVGLELVKGFQVIGSKDARKLQTTKFIKKGR
jgi:hypothetical protein